MVLLGVETHCSELKNVDLIRVTYVAPFYSRRAVFSQKSFLSLQQALKKASTWPYVNEKNKLHIIIDRNECILIKLLVFKNSHTKETETYSIS